MAKTAYKTWVTGETVTAAQLNEQVRDNGNALWTGTTKGDIEFFNSATVKNRLPIGTNGQFLGIVLGVPAWQTITFPNPYTTKGDMIYSNPSSTQVRLPIGTNGQILSVSSTGIPDWVGPTGASVTRGTSQQSVANDTEVEVANFVTENFDYGGFWASGNKITIPAGLPTTPYLIVAHGYWDGHSSNAMLRELGIKVGSSIRAKVSAGQAEGSSAMWQEVHMIRLLAPGDTVTLTLLQKSGGTLYFNEATLSVVMMR
jgi:hypothetical protein